MFHLSRSKHINFAGLLKQTDNLLGRIPQIKKRRRIRRIYKSLKIFCILAAALLFAMLILFSAEIFSFKSLYVEAVLGKANLEQAMAFNQQGKFSQAMVLAKTAESNFSVSINNFGQIKNDQFLNQFSAAADQFNGLESLLISSKFLSKAVYGGASFGKSLENAPRGGEKLSFSKLSAEEKHKILRKLFESAPELNGVKADLDLADLSLEQINLSNLLPPLRGKITQTKNQIYQARQIMEKAAPLSQLLPALAGYPKLAKYLVIFQNNDVLKPTGGSLDAYGILEILNGEIVSFNTHDVDYLDAPAKGKIMITPPGPIKKYLTRPAAGGWYLRDANWSPDWPTAAKKIAWFYQIESSFNSEAEKIAEFDGVIAITPELVADFLGIAGPVTVQDRIYDQTNFQNLLASASKRPGKEVLGEIIKELKIRIFDLPPASRLKAMNTLIDNLVKKDLLLYLTDNQLEKIALDNSWGGEINSTAGDYIMVADTNLNSAAGDSVISRNLEYKVSQGANGLFAKLTLNYANQGQTLYKCYTRVYAPLGSQLIRVNGFELEQIDSGNESGKNWFGFYLTAESGKINSLIVEYKLPSSVLSGNSYRLYIQKQPGKEASEAAVDLSFLNDIKSYNPVSLYVKKISQSRISWEGDLNMDRIFEVRF